MISNIETYLAIAREAHAEMKKLDDASRRPKPDGSAGHIVTYDRDRRSFKQAMIAIAFASMYFEAAIYLTARQALSQSKAKRIDHMWYEHRLPALRITDPSLVAGAKALREVRNELVHDKAITPEEVKNATLRFAQESANQALDFINRLDDVLKGAA